MQKKITEENLPPESIEYLKSLVTQFRELAEAKDSVIRHYRELLERIKPILDREMTTLKKFAFHHKEITELKDVIAELKRDQVTKKRKAE